MRQVCRWPEANNQYLRRPVGQRGDRDQCRRRPTRTKRMTIVIDTTSSTTILTARAGETRPWAYPASSHQARPAPSNEWSPRNRSTRSRVRDVTTAGRERISAATADFRAWRSCQNQG